MKSPTPEENSEDENDVDNPDAIAGTLINQVEKGSDDQRILTAMEVPSVSTSMYSKASDEIDKVLLEASEENKLKAGREEAELGDAQCHAYCQPMLVEVFLRHQLRSISRCRNIIGIRTRKVSYVGIRNKYVP